MTVRRTSARLNDIRPPASATTRGPHSRLPDVAPRRLASHAANHKITSTVVSTVAHALAVTGACASAENIQPRVRRLEVIAPAMAP